MPCELIDLHAYLGRDAYGDYSQTADELIVSMDACQIKLAVVARLLDFPGPDPQVHQILREAVQCFPDRLSPFARLEPMGLQSRRRREPLQSCVTLMIGLVRSRSVRSLI